MPKRAMCKHARGCGSIDNQVATYKSSIVISLPTCPFDYELSDKCFQIRDKSGRPTYPLCACRIISEASSYASGKVRVECITGLRRFGAIASLKPGNSWSRLVEDLQLYPT
jgi:hypothetical protein